MFLQFVTILALITKAIAHTALWTPAMWCFGNNVSTVDDPNADIAVHPIYQQSFDDFWFQKYSGCLNAPPATGQFLELPAGGSYTGELAHNRAFTTYSYNGRLATDWPDGQNHTEPWVSTPDAPDPGCLSDGAQHTNNQSTAAGTAIAISYNSNIEDVTPENLVVFTITANTPWKRIVTYEIPKALPACPPAGCICAWLWV